MRVFADVWPAMRLRRGRAAGPRQYRHATCEWPRGSRHDVSRHITSHRLRVCNALFQAIELFLTRISRASSRSITPRQPTATHRPSRRARGSGAVRSLVASPSSVRVARAHPEQAHRTATAHPAPPQIVTTAASLSSAYIHASTRSDNRQQTHLRSRLHSLQPAGKSYKYRCRRPRCSRCMCVCV